MADCAVCEKIKEKKARIVYEDDDLIAVLPSKPATLGHIKLMPKKHATKIDELEPELFQSLLFLSNFASSTVFDVFKAHGTNIILNEGDGHLAIDVIPRKDGDGMNFLWAPKQLPPEEFDNVFSKIKDKAFVIGKSEKKAPVVEEKKQILRISDSDILPPEPPETTPPADAKQTSAPDSSAAIKDKEEKVNYLLKNLQKIP